MKKIIFSVIALVGLFAFSSCEKDEDQAVLTINSSSLALADLSADSYILDRDASDEAFEEFTWSKADFGFDASITYVLELDSVTNEFANPVVLATLNNKLAYSLTVGALNELLVKRGFATGEAVELEFRVVASVSANADEIVSPIQTATITPYATSFPPIYMCGAATGGWDWTKGVEVLSTAPDQYQTVAYFISGETFRFFAQANWGPTSYNYPYFTTVAAGLENALDDDKNFRVTSATGYYRISCNLKTKVVDFVSVPEPKMFMTGAALGGWDWTTNYVQMTFVKDNVWTATTDFAVETFRFFAQAGWSPDSYNYPYMSTVDPLFENANDDDKNFKFIGTPGSYKITFNLAAKTVDMEAVN